MGKVEWRLVAAAGFFTFISLLLTLLRNLSTLIFIVKAGGPKPPNLSQQPAQE
jgi:hypothetical protein